MPRSIWKGPFVDPSLIKKVEKLKDQINKPPIKTWSRKSTIIPEFVGISFLIYNGKKFIPIKISEEMVGHKLGEFSPTRQFFGHTPADKKAAQVKEQDLKAKTEKLGRKGKFKALLLDPSFPQERPTILEDLTDEHCRWPLGEKLNPAKFFCGRKPVDKFPYCELHLLYGYVSKNEKEEDAIGDVSTLNEPEVVEELIKNRVD